MATQPTPMSIEQDGSVVEAMVIVSPFLIAFWGTGTAIFLVVTCGTTAAAICFAITVMLAIVCRVATRRHLDDQPTAPAATGTPR